MGRPPLPGHVTGGLVDAALIEVHPAGLMLPQLVVATELSPAQVRAGLSRVMSEQALARGLVKLYTRRDGHQYSKDIARILAYERQFFRTESNRFARFAAGVLLPHKALQPDDPYITNVITVLSGYQGQLALLAAG